MSTIERIQRVETELNMIAKLVAKNTMSNGDFINGIRVTISDDSENIESSYWFGLNSKIEKEIIELYLKGLNNSLRWLLKTLKEETEQANLILEKYK